MSHEDLRTAIREGDEETFHELVDEVDLDGTGDGTVHLLEVAQWSGSPEFVRELLERDVDPDAGMSDGFTPLYDAVRMQQPEIATLLLEAGADPNAEVDSGKRPLHEAIRLDLPDVATLLLEHGADPTHEDVYGNTPVSFLRTHAEAAGDEERFEEYFELLTDEQLAHEPSGPDPTGLAADHERVPVEEVDELAEWTWEELVPPSGQADTVQGELRRAVERLRSEAHRNGNGNWSEDYEMLLDFLERHLCDEDLFEAETIERTRSDVEHLRGGTVPRLNDDVYSRLTARVVEFCERQPELIEKPKDDDLRI